MGTISNEFSIWFLMDFFFFLLNVIFIYYQMKFIIFWPLESKYLPVFKKQRANMRRDRPRRRLTDRFEPSGNFCSTKTKEAVSYNNFLYYLRTIEP